MRTTIDANIQAFLNVLEGCRARGCQHLVYASSSSVCGANTKLPFSIHDNVDHPISLYAASKKANELTAHSYSHLYRVPATGLRFFTVYGSWGRPDMAMFILAKAILSGQPIKLFNHGRMRRDFTYFDDISQTIVRLVVYPPPGRADWDGARPDPATSLAPWKIYNVGNSHPEELTHVVSLLEKELGKSATREMHPMQPGDVEATYADVRKRDRLSTRHVDRRRNRAFRKMVSRLLSSVETGWDDSTNHSLDHVRQCQDIVAADLARGRAEVVAAAIRRDLSRCSAVKRLKIAHKFRWRQLP